ncbi:coiled-coil domain-containing protein [Peristeroidobacter agariperforans]|uniref:hypothetical protein n=1 Tax=Peristeroidobacter agariperforans TaxID=268404 RepID=UPI00101CD2E8|nr:hypothetical protein [Peristeroidobacter agariperforans]
MEHFALRSGWCALVALAATTVSATEAPVTIIKHGSVDLMPLTPPDAQPAGGEGDANRLEFRVGEQAKQFEARMRERMADPEQRSALRAEQQAELRKQHAAVGSVLGLDETTVDRLIERLTDRQMDQLELIYGQPENRLDLQRQAEMTTRHMNELGELLGEQGLVRYERYAASLPERRQVEALSARFAAENELRPDQKERLIALFHERTRRSLEAMQGSRWTLRSLGPGELSSPEQMQRASQLSTIEANEQSWREREVTNREIEAQAAAFLNPGQLTELSTYQAQEQERLRRRVESMRAQAGLNPHIPERAAPASERSEPRVLVDQQVQIEIRFTVNRAEPKLVSRTVRNGEAFTFEAAEGLIIEATPRLYEDHWLDVQMTYFEQDAAGKHPLPGGDTFGVRTRSPDGQPMSGGGGSLIKGRKGYAMNAMFSATAM